MCKIENCYNPTYAKKLCRLHYSQIRHAKNRERDNARKRAWYASLSETVKARSKARNAAHPEITSLINHRVWIKQGRATYTDMPFFDGWDPTKGGSSAAGERWIIEHIGRRPSKGWDLHIVDRRIGFMPNNLQWIPRSKHQQEEMISRLLRENQDLRGLLEVAGVIRLDWAPRSSPAAPASGRPT